MDEVKSILEERTEETVRRMLNRAMASESLTATVQYKLVGKLCDSIDAASESMLRQIGFLKECIEGARNSFIAESGDLRKSMEEIRSSLEIFRKSNKESSSALTRATYVLAGVALIQAIIFLMQWLK